MEDRGPFKGSNATISNQECDPYFSELWKKQFVDYFCRPLLFESLTPKPKPLTKLDRLRLWYQEEKWRLKIVSKLITGKISPYDFESEDRFY
jgi:hypothetical protein